MPGAVEVDFGASFVGVAEDDEMFARFPETEDAFAAVGFAQIQ